MKNKKSANMDSGAKTDIKAIRKPKDIHAGVGELEERLERLLGLFRNVPTTSIGCGEESAFQAVQNVIDSLNRALSTYEVLANQCFVSELIDEWLKDSHCLDNQDAWDADPKRPFPFNVVMAFIKNHEPFDSEDLRSWMTGVALRRMVVIGRMVENRRVWRLVQVVRRFSLRGSREIAEAMDYLGEAGLRANDADSFLRCVSLYLKVCCGEWPFEYVGPSRVSDADRAS